MKHTKGLDFLMKKNKITVVRGHGRLTGPASDGVLTVDVTAEDKGKGQRLQAEGFTQQTKTEVKAKKVVLATGSDARMLPGYKADDTILTNIEILSLPDDAEVARRHRLRRGRRGVRLDLQELRRRRHHPRSAAAHRSRRRRRGLQGTHAPVQEARHRRQHLLQGREDREDQGRREGQLHRRRRQAADPKKPRKSSSPWAAAPRTYDAGIDKTNIQLDRGFVTVNEWMETSEPGVYAIGDIVAGLPQLAHVGAMAGVVVASKLAGKYARAVRKDRVPGCTYCDPQIGSVGLTEAQAKEKGYQVKVGKFPFVGNSKATIVDSHDGFVKVVSDAKYGEILGVHIIGPQATELIAECVAAMELEATVEEMMFTIHAHPTLYESLLDGFASVEGMAINV